MTTCDTGSVLLRNVLADPASDTARLVYADWLEEQGEADRAEFVRVSVAVAANGGYYEGCREPHPNAIVGCGRCDHCRLTMRLDKLTGYAPDVLRFVWDGPGWCWAHRPYPDSPLPAGCPEFTIARGWPWRVACDLGWVLAHASDLFGRHPITAVVLTDRGPDDLGYGWGWYQGPYDAAGDYIPADIARHFKPLPSHWVWETEEAAHAALAAACVAYGRKLAGLPPL